MSWCKILNKWVANVTIKGKTYRLGGFSDKEKAKEAIDQKREEIKLYSELILEQFNRGQPND